MSSSNQTADLTIELQARLAELESLVQRKESDFSRLESELKQLQGKLLLAQAQILELGDLLAAKNTELKNAGVNNLSVQGTLDAQLARTDELKSIVRSLEDQVAAKQLELAACTERMMASERTSRSAVAEAQKSSEALQSSLAAVQADLTGHRKHAANLEEIIGQLRTALATAEKSAASNLQRAQEAETATTIRNARLKQLESHWVWRATRLFHD